MSIQKTLKTGNKELVSVSKLETWNKSFEQLKTLKTFFKELEKSRYQATLSSSEMEELLKEKSTRIKIGEIKHNKEIQKKLALYVGDITFLDADLLLNSANPMLTCGGGLMYSFWTKGGEELHKELEEIMEKRGNSPLFASEFAISKGFIKNQRIMHMIAPRKTTGLEKRKIELKQCYENVLNYIKNNKKIKTIGLVSLGTGKYEFPLLESVHITCSVLRKWLENAENRNNIDKIVICLNNPKLHAIFEVLMGLYFPD